MSEQDAEPTAIRRRQHEVVAILVRQNDGVDILERSVRPLIPAARPAHPDEVLLEVRTGIATAAESLWLESDEKTLHAVLYDTGVGDPQLAEEASADEEVDGSRPRSIGPVPNLDEFPELRAWCAGMRDTLREQIVLARDVVAHAARLDSGPDHGRDRLEKALDAADEERRRIRFGHLETARQLTQIWLPIPEDGVPGQATVRAHLGHLASLALLGLAHRALVWQWCENAIRRCQPMRDGADD